MYREDLRLPGYIPLIFGRDYRSGRQEKGSFGFGWRLNLNLSLSVEPERLVYAPDTPHETVFSRVDEDMQARHAAGVLLQHYPDRYVLEPAPDRRLVFAKEHAQDDTTIPLSRIEDRQGNEVHFFFDHDRLVGIVDTVGRQVRFDYQSGTVHRVRLTEDRSSPRILRTFRYSGTNDLVTETDAAGHSTSFGYHDHLMVEYTNRCGGTQYAQYDGERRCCALWYDDQSQGRRFAYDEARSSARVIGATGRQSLYRYVPSGQVIERIDSEDRSQNYYYDDLNRLVGFSDEDETVQTLRHLDVEEGVFTCLDTEERAAYLEIDESLRLTAVLDAQDRRATLAYGDEDRPTAYRTETEGVWGFDRDDRGAVSRIRSPSGTEVRLRRGSDGQSLIVEDEEGLLMEDHFDECGRLVERTDGLRRRFQWLYDPNGRLKSVRVASQSLEFAYDPEGNVTRIQDASGRVSTFTYDAFGRLREWEGARRQFLLDYDGAGSVGAIEDGEGRTTRYEYDNHGRVARILHPDGRETIYERRDDGTLVSVDGEDGETRSRFNHGGDPVQLQQPNGAFSQYTYGPSGALLVAERGDDSFSFSYEDDGLLGEVQVGSEALALQYDADGQLGTLRRDESTMVECRRDGRGRLTGLEVNDRHYQIEYDAGNRLRSIQTGAHRWTFGYDVLDHVIEWEGPGLSSTPRDEVLRLSLSETASEEDPMPEIVVHGARNGIVLSVGIGGSCIPLWGRRNYVQSGLPMTPALRAATLVRGEGPLRDLLDPSASFDRLREWTNLLEGGLRWNCTEIPEASDLQRPSWTRLNRFFLRRPYYVLGDPTLVPGESFGDRPSPARSPDEWATGTHVSGHLRSSLWAQRRGEHHLYPRGLGMKPGPKGPFDLLHALTQTTSWR